MKEMTSMRTATLVNRLNGVKIKVYSTTDHPDSHYNIPVWVDEEGVAYIEDVERENPFYAVEDVRDDEE